MTDMMHTLALGVIKGLPQDAAEEDKRAALEKAGLAHFGEPQYGKDLKEIGRRWTKERENAWNRVVESRLQPVPKVSVARNKVVCGWCGGRGCAACYNAREATSQTD
jgi:hypothetical protein